MKLAEIETLQTALSFLSVKDLTVEELKQLLKLKKQVDTIVKDNKELQKEVMNKFDVKEASKNTYYWKEHPKRDAIEEDIETIKNAIYILDVCNFLDINKIKLTSIDSLPIMESLIDNLAKV